MHKTGIPHREVEKSGEAEGTGTNRYPPPHEGDHFPWLTPPFQMYRTCLHPLSGRAGGKNSVLVWLNSKHLSQNGDAGCVVHVHKFCGDHEQHQVMCNQCVHIVISKHTCHPMKTHPQSSSRGLTSTSLGLSRRNHECVTTKRKTSALSSSRTPTSTGLGLTQAHSCVSSSQSIVPIT